MVTHLTPKFFNCFDTRGMAIQIVSKLEMQASRNMDSIIIQYRRTDLLHIVISTGMRLYFHCLK